MVRNNGKLKPFLLEALNEDKFANLKWDCDLKIWFTLVLPHYKNKEPLKIFEEILIAWYRTNGNIEKYVGYSKGKSVLQAALKKSIYLVSSKTKKHQFKFANLEEIKEKKRIQKEKDNRVLNNQISEASNSQIFPEVHETPSTLDDLKCVSSPSCSEASSGYHSEKEDFDENLSVVNAQNNDLNDMLTHPEKYIGENVDDLFDDIYRMIDDKMTPNMNQEMPVENQQELPSNLSNVTDLFNPPQEIQNLLKPVIELKATEVDTSKFLKTFWLCTKKLYVDSVLMLIGDKQVLENDDPGIKDGQIIIPNNVWEPGVLYDFQKSFECGQKLFCFFLPVSV